MCAPEKDEIALVVECHNPPPPERWVLQQPRPDLTELVERKTLVRAERPLDERTDRLSARQLDCG